MTFRSNRGAAAKAIPAAVGTAAAALLALLFLTYFKFPVFWAVPLTAVLVFLFWKMLRVRSGRILISCAALAPLLALSFVAGGKFRMLQRDTEPFYRSDLLYLTGLAVIFFVALVPCMQALAARTSFSGQIARPFSLRPGAVWAFSSVFFFLCWVPCIAVYYPGSISPDSLACITRAIGRAGLSNQQPVFYILLMRPFLLFSLSLGKGLDFGCMLFLTAQAAAMAAMLGYVPAWLRKSGAPLWSAVLCGAFFTLIPVFPMYAVTMWKDIPFAGLMTVYVLNLCDIVRSRGEWLRGGKNLSWFLALNLLLAFLRNNGYYVVAVTLILLAAIYRKNWKRLAPCFLAVLILIPAVQGPVYRLCGVTPSPFAESVGIPLQQIGYTVTHNGNVTPEQKEFLNQVIPYGEIREAYNPITSNGIKFHEDFNNAFLEKNKVQFLRVWAAMLVPNFGSYVKAYLLETVGYWHVGTTGWVLYYGTGDGYGAKELGLSLSSSFGSPTVRTMRDNIKANFGQYQNQMKILSSLINIGFLFWASVLAALLLFLRKGAKSLLAFLPLLLLWGTLMVASPTYCEFRYMFAFATVLPALLAMPFLPGGGELHEWLSCRAE